MNRDSAERPSKFVADWVALACTRVQVASTEEDAACVVKGDTPGVKVLGGIVRCVEEVHRDERPLKKNTGRYATPPRRSWWRM